MKDNIVEEINRVEKSQYIKNTIIAVFTYIAFIILLVVIFYLSFKYINTKDHSNSDPITIITEATISDIYKDRTNVYTKYYIKAKSFYGTYNIEISIGSFMKYKIGDTINIKIKSNGNAYIMD